MDTLLRYYPPVWRVPASTGGDTNGRTTPPGNPGLATGRRDAEPSCATVRGPFQQEPAAEATRYQPGENTSAPVETRGSGLVWGSSASSELFRLIVAPLTDPICTRKFSSRGRQHATPVRPIIDRCRASRRRRQFTNSATCLHFRICCASRCSTMTLRQPHWCGAGT